MLLPALRLIAAQSRACSFGGGTRVCAVGRTTPGQLWDEGDGGGLDCSPSYDAQWLRFTLPWPSKRLNTHAGRGASGGMPTPAGAGGEDVPRARVLWSFDVPSLPYSSPTVLPSTSWFVLHPPMSPLPQP